MADDSKGKAGEGNEGQEGKTNVGFEDWLKEQPDEIQAKYNDHITGLKNTVKATRSERDDLKNQLTETLKKAEKGSELETQLTEALKKLEVTEKKATFFDEAIKPEIGCRNPRVAYALALAEDMFTRSGAPDWPAIKKLAPELFGIDMPKGKAGSGTDDNHKATDMNSIIRRAAGAQ